MAIIYNEKMKQFHLYNDEISYIMEVTPEGYLLQVYYGERIKAFKKSYPYPLISRSSFSPGPYTIAKTGFSLDVVMQECPGYDTGDYREGLVEFTYSDGTKATCLTYKSHDIYSGKKKLDGLPATYANEDSDATTLEITMVDEIRKVEIILSYAIFENIAALTKSAQIINKSQDVIELNKGLSACVDFDHSQFELIQMPGSWSREKQLVRSKIVNGIQVLDSKRGASGVNQQPFMALVDPKTDEFSGAAYGFHFVYSGNFTMKTQVDTFLNTRVLVGINEFNFKWQLTPDESFQTPEVVLTYSNRGLNKLSHAFHQLYRHHLIRGHHQYKERPVLLNNWETTYFDFDETKLMELADSAKDMGIELFMLDDGWFGKRNSDETSLGDWFVNKEKLPNGLTGLAEKINAKGLKFGLWFEPEMISEESDLFKAHPDWHIHVKNYPSSLGRHQLILDFSRPVVREEIYQQMIKILDEVPIAYIKWDMNRNMTEVGSLGRTPEEQMETSHRYMLGLYELLERLTTRYPHILFENCSGGGGRFDPGMTYYMPQSWSSDNTDAIERLKIQYSTSMIFPPLVMCAHLSEVPNHQTGRVTDIETRAAVAMSANFGVMLNPTRVSEEDLEKAKGYVAWYKKNRQLIQFGDFYRLQNPFETNQGSFMFVDEAKENAIFVFVQILNQANQPLTRVKLAGLDPDTDYDIDGDVYTGDELMKFGLYVNLYVPGDFHARTIEIKKKN